MIYLLSFIPTVVIVDKMWQR